MSAWDNLPVVPGGGDAKPTEKTDAKPWDKLPVVSSSTPPPAADSPSLAQEFFKGIGNIGHHIAADFKEGMADERKAQQMAAAGPNTLKGSLAGPEAVLGAIEVAGSPVSGIAKSIGDAARAEFPQDTTWGKMAAQSVEDAAMIFGPEVAPSLIGPLKNAAGPVKRLMDSGVQLTLGQISGKLAKRFEEGAKSVPILGHFIRNAEGRTIDSFNVATVNKALGPIGAKVTAKDGREAIIQAHQMADNEYNKVRAGVTALHQTPQFDSDIQQLRIRLDEMTEANANRWEAILKNRVLDRFGGIRSMDGKEFKAADNELSQLAAASTSSPDPAERNFGHAIQEMRGVLRDELARQFPTIKADLDKIDHTYSMLADIDRAGSNRATARGRFTPGDLLTSIKRADKSPRDRRFFEGTARELQPWAEDAYEIMGNKLPDSGSAERLTIEGLATEMISPKLLVGAGVASLPYTKTGQAAVNAVKRDLPQIVGTSGSILGRAGQAAGVAETLGLQ